MKTYTQQLAGCRKLTKAEEREAHLLAKSGDKSARDTLILSQLQYAFLIAKRYQNRGLPLEDLVQCANIGVISAVDHFDPDRGRLSTVTHLLVRQEIGHSLQAIGRLIRIPRGYFTHPATADQQPPTVEQADDFSDLDLRDTHNPVEQAIQNETSEIAWGLVNRLPPEPRKILRLRYKRGETYIQIAKRLGKHHDAIIRIANSAVSLLASQVAEGAN